MPKGGSYGSWDDYGVAKETKRSATREAPHAYATRQQPAKSKAGVGRIPTARTSFSGGGMQGGGKRRPNRKP